MVLTSASYALAETQVGSDWFGDCGRSGFVTVVVFVVTGHGDGFTGGGGDCCFYGGVGSGERGEGGIATCVNLPFVS